MAHGSARFKQATADQWQSVRNCGYRNRHTRRCLVVGVDDPILAANPDTGILVDVDRGLDRRCGGHDVAGERNDVRRHLANAVDAGPEPDPSAGWHLCNRNCKCHRRPRPAVAIERGIVRCLLWTYRLGILDHVRVFRLFRAHPFTGRKVAIVCIFVVATIAPTVRDRLYRASIPNRVNATNAAKHPILREESKIHGLFSNSSYNVDRAIPANRDQ
jgi:hypothetical protein